MIARALLTTAPLQIVQAILGFATIWAFTRLMTPGEYGAYALLLSVSMLAHTLVFTWAEAAAFRFLPTDAQERANHFATLKRIVLISSALAFGMLAFATQLPALSLAAGLATAAIFYRFIGRLLRESERAEQRMGAFVAAEIGYAIGGFAIGVVLLLTTSLGPAAPFAGQFAAAALLALRDAPMLFRKARSGAADKAALWRYARYGFPLAAALALDVGVQASVRAILMIGHGAAEAGVYAAAFGLARPIDLFCAWLGLSAAPILLAAWRNGAKDVAAAARKAGTALLLIAAPAAAGLALTAQPLAEVMAGGGIAPSVAAALPWLAFAGLMNGAALHFWSEAFQLRKRTGLRIGLIASAAAFQLALTAMLAPAYGAAGAAMAATAGAALSLCLLGRFGARIAPFALALPDVARIGSATFVMSPAVLAIPDFGGLLELATKIAVGVLAYAAGLYAFGGPEMRARASVILQRVSVMVPALRMR